MNRVTELAMNPPITFDQLLDAVERLPSDEQAALMAIVSRRLAERGRQRIAEEASQASREFAGGQCASASVDDIMGEIES
jgi:hypothetical protein